MGEDYARILRESLESIAKQLERDLSTAERENSYITDPTAIVLRVAASELDRCNISPRISDSSIDRLAWFVGGDAEKIRQLQRKLNELNITARLTEDGVYGRKTLAASNTFAERLARGAFPSAALINPLQSRFTKIYSVVNETQKDGVTIRTASLRDRSSRSRNKKQDITVFKVDPPDEVWPRYHHINTVRGGTLRDGKYVASARQLKNLDALNHRKISEQAYKLLKNFNGTAKKVRVAGGTILAVAGDAAEILELSSALYLDWSADKKLGKDSLAAGVRVVGDWGVSLAASEFGAWAGSTIGTFFLPGIGTAIGGTAGGLIFGIIGSFAGDALEEWVIDITNLED